MKVLQIGVGKWGINHYRVWKKFIKAGKIDTLYLYDKEKNLSHLEDDNIYDLKTSVGDDFNLEDFDLQGIDLVDIVTPPHTHYKIALKILKMSIGKNVKIFIEKPVTMNMHDLISLNSQTLNEIMVGHIFRYHTGIIEARNMIFNGDIGDVKMIYMNRLATREYDERNDILLELMIHDIDILSYWGLLNQSNLKGSFSKGTGIIHGMNNGGVEFLITGSWDHPEKVRNIKVVGSEGTIEIDMMDNTQIKYNNQVIPITYYQPLMTELLHFVTQSKENKGYISGIDKIMDVMSAVYRIQEHSR